MSWWITLTRGLLWVTSVSSPVAVACTCDVTAGDIDGVAHQPESYGCLSACSVHVVDATIARIFICCVCARV